MNLSSSSVAAIRDVVEEFVAELHHRVGSRKLERLLAADETLASSDIRQRPAAFVEDELVWHVLAGLDLDRTIRPYGEDGGTGEWPDFELTNLSESVLGVNKSLNRIDEGQAETRDYLDRKSLGPDFGIATDGIEWVLVKIERSGDFTEFPEIDRVDLRPVFQQVARDNGYVGQSSVDAVDVKDALSEFLDVFERDALDTRLTEAPRKLRDRRQRDVEAFYELYIELLFGESDDYADDYETCLLDDIRPPSDMEVGEGDQRLFAVTLMNRLLFVKFLEQRGVLNDDEETPFLLERLQEYEAQQAAFAADFYESQIKSLFYELLNTPIDDRDPKYDSGWSADVPYLNGGLFRTNVAREKEYRVLDRTLPDIIRDLIEGSQLELSSNGFDPALIGSVFEMTINHLDEDADRSETGAYYTPNDVTELVTEQSVDPKLRETIVEAYVDELGGTDEDTTIIRNQLESKSLAEILQRVEDGEGWYSDPDAIDAALDHVGDLTVVDPACGSGHFLTTAMDEIHRAQLSLMRGKGGGEPPAHDRYEAKKTLALNTVYGVDIEPVGVEIAKLRVWLKMVEGNGWSPEFGHLPNIDVNIAAGNSLVGFPVLGTIETMDVWDERVEDLVDLREAYKFGDEASGRDRKEICRLLDREIRPQLNREFVRHLNFTVETTVERVDEFDRVTSHIEESTLFPTVESVKLRREDGGPIEDDVRLEDLGFTVYSKSARLVVQDRERALKDGGDGDAREDLEAELRGLLEDGYVFDELVRQPLACDLDDILGDPFHWTAEFPEVASRDNGRQTSDFDIVLGNPPYGDLLNDAETVLVDGYETSSIPDISAHFVERQLQLLAEGGYFGNVTTLRLVYQSSIEELHDLLREKLSGTRVANFGSRPSRVFENADIKVAIFTGKRVDGDDPIHTSDAIIFTDENRAETFADIEYGSTADLVLRDEIGGNEGRRSILPKVGSETKRNLLVKLRDYEGPPFGEVYDRDDPGIAFPVWRREGIRYWTSVMREKLYEAREVKPMYYGTELQGDAAFITLNSSLFYTYWLTYGNFHHLNWTQIEAFPFPTEETLNEYAEAVHTLSDELWQEMEHHYYAGRGLAGEFEMRPVKPVIDRIDDLLQDIYGLSDEEVEFVKNYLTDCGPGTGRVGPTDEDVRSYVTETED